MNTTLFSELELSEPIARVVKEMGFETATDIQAQTIPLLREGRDVIGRSQTGTGKTLAFGIPAVECIDPGERCVQVLIMAPTRELSMQACEEIQKLAKYKPGVKTVDIYGGAPMVRQITLLKNGANIVVGTPGRIMDHLRRRTLRLDGLRMVILDEADEMLSMGFKEDIETILSGTPDQRQTVLFSATMPPAILALTRDFQRDPQLVEIDRKQPSVKAIAQSWYEAPMGRKMDALALILLSKDPKLAMVFCNTKKMTEELSVFLKQQGFKAEGLHGDMKQTQRTQVMNAFKAHEIRILVATDVAARGIDVDDIEYVINYDIPQDIEYYIHRIGRTGRAGKSGAAITLCSGRKQSLVMGQIARLTRSEIHRENLPTPTDVLEKRAESALIRVENAIKEAADMPYMPMVETLKSRGYTPEIIAAVALGLKFGGKRVEIAEIVEEKKRAVMGGEMSKIVLSLGRDHRIAPNHIVGAIAEASGLSGKDIGKIEIYDQKTVVGVPTEAMDRVIDSLRGIKILGQKVSAEQHFEERGSYRPGKGKFSGAPNFPRRSSNSPARRNDGPRGGFSGERKKRSWDD